MRGAVSSNGAAQVCRCINALTRQHRHTHARHDRHRMLVSTFRAIFGPQCGAVWRQQSNLLIFKKV